MSDYNSVFIPPAIISNSSSKNNNNNNITTDIINEPKIQKILTRKLNNSIDNNNIIQSNNKDSSIKSPINSEVVSKQLKYLHARSKYFDENIQDHDTVFAESTIYDDYDPNNMILIGNNNQPSSVDELLDREEKINKQQQFIVKLKQPKAKVKEEEREEYSRNSLPLSNYNNPSLYNRSSYPGYGGNNNQNGNINTFNNSNNNNFQQNFDNNRTNYNNNSMKSFDPNQFNVFNSNNNSNNSVDNSSLQTATWSKVATTNQPFSSFQTPAKSFMKEKSVSFIVKLEGFGLSVPMWDVDTMLNPVKESGGMLDFTNYSKDKYVLATFTSYSDTEKALARLKGSNIRTTILS